MTDKVYELMDWPKIEDVIYSECDDPQSVLGARKHGKSTLIQAFFPDSLEVYLQLLQEETEEEEVIEELPMEMVDENGYYAIMIGKKQSAFYRFHVVYEDREEIVRDAYWHSSLIDDDDVFYFINGIHYTIYEKLGAHPMNHEGEEGTYFAVWAPNAHRVSVVGDFNHWDGRIHQMKRVPHSGIFELFIPDAKVGQNYKYEIKLKTGLTYLKADPYANAMQLRPDDASVIADISDFDWEDDKFIASREERQGKDKPISIYEMYLGSFINGSDGAQYATYRQIADQLVPYIRDMGYTHVELMPVMEHDDDESWGYITTGFFAPTARYGDPEGLMYLINELHKANIGVILDVAPAYFPKGNNGLADFDGSKLYEHPNENWSTHPVKGTLMFDYGKKEVSNFLIASALFWVEKFHADGIRMDDVASMIYLDYSRGEGQWVPNVYGRNENLEAIELIKHLNSIMKKRNPGVLSLLEGKIAYPMLTGSLDEGGLGFDLKWNLNFTADLLDYMHYDPFFRSHHHSELTFSLIYAFTERFLLAISHNDVSGGKNSMVGKMPGNRERKFANLRLTYSYMMTHPGKKMLFMGQDFGEFDEWDKDHTLEWDLMEYSVHSGLSYLVRSLNELYKTYPALYAYDDDPDSFMWLNNLSANDCYLSYARVGNDPEEMLIVVANFAGVSKEITTGVPMAGKYKEIFNSDATEFGGSGVTNPRVKVSKPKVWDEQSDSISVKMAPLSISILQYKGE